jgi:histidinol-phosphate/aromatic aminotransferase/cobyric acid decarboxylase-like protein
MNQYLHVNNQKIIDCCYTSNFDEEYANIFPVINKKEAVDIIAKYPDYTYQGIVKKIKKKYKVDQIALGSGSEDLILRINEILRTLKFRLGIVTPIFHRISETSGGHSVALEADRLESYNLKKMQAIWIQNPNLFTGSVMDAKKILKLVKANRSVIFFIDEAAIFTMDAWLKYSLLKYTKTNSNLIVLESFSKMHGLSGMRSGFAAGNNDLIVRLINSETTFPYTSLTVKFVEKVLQSDMDIFLHKLRHKIKKNKLALCKITRQQGDILISDSPVNCLFFRSKSHVNIYKKLLRAGILTLDMSGAFGDGSAVRMTIHSSRKTQTTLTTRFIKAINY